MCSFPTRTFFNGAHNSFRLHHIMKRLHTVALALYIAMVLYACGGREGKGGDAEPGEAPSIRVTILNQSQFELHHIFFHDPDRNYKETNSLIKSNLGKEQSFSHLLDRGTYRVTVTRLKNKDGPLWAFTTQNPIQLTRPVLLEFFDSHFRLSDMKDVENASIPAESNAGDMTGVESVPIPAESHVMEKETQMP